MGKYSDFFASVDQQAAQPDTYLDIDKPTREQAQPPAQTATKPEPKEQPGILSDAASLYGMGSGQLVKAAGWLFDSETLSSVGQDTVDYWENELSSAQREAGQQRFVKDDYSIGEGATNPRTWMGTIVQSLPMMVPGVGAAGLGGRIALKAGASKGAASTAAAASGSASEGAIIGSMVGEEVQSAIMDAPKEEYQNSPYYQDLVSAGKSPEEAHRMMAEKAAQSAGLQSGVVGAILGVGFNKFVGDAVTGRLSKRLAAETGKGVAEGAGTELAQTGVEAYTRQSALNEELGRPFNPAEAVNEMVGGAGAGAAMGGAVGFAGGVAGSDIPEKPSLTDEVVRARTEAEAAGADDLDATRAGANEILKEFSKRPEPRAYDAPIPDIGGLMAQAQAQVDGGDTPDLWSPSNEPRPYSIAATATDMTPKSAPLSEQVGTDVNQEGPQIVYDQDGGTVTQEGDQFRAFNQDGLETFGKDAGDARRKLSQQIERNQPKGPVLQNRDRSTPGYVAQMDQIANAPDYDQVSASKTAESGAPMVFRQGQSPDVPDTDQGRSETITMADGSGGTRKIQSRYAVIEADQLKASNNADGSPNTDYGKDGIIALNNGRTAGLQEAYNRGTAEPYREAMQSDAQALGIDPAAVASKQKPVLVRLFDGSQLDGINDPGAASNTRLSADLSMTEQARTDARKLSPQILSDIQPGDPTGSGNTDFVRRAVETLSDGDKNTKLRDSKTGLLTAEGQKRIRGALIERAYTDETLTRELVEATDSDLKTLGDALAETSGRWALMREQAKQGAINPDMDITDALTTAINMIRKSRQEGQSLKDLAGQIDAFAGEADQMAAHILSLFYRGANFNRIRSKDAIAGALNNYIETALQSSPGPDMFGEQIQPQEVLNRERDGAEAETQTTPPRVQPDGSDNRESGTEGEGRSSGAGRAENAETGETRQPEVAPEAETAVEPESADAPPVQSSKAESAEAGQETPQQKADALFESTKNADGVEVALEKAQQDGDDTLHLLLRNFRRDSQFRAKANDLFTDMADFYTESDNKDLARMAETAVRRRDDADIKETLLARNDGDLTGLQLQNKAGTQGAVFLPDASEPGRFRVSYFDEKGFYGHATRDTYEAALNEAWTDGFRKEADNLLEQWAAKDTFTKGNAIASLIAEVNRGDITHTEYLKRAKELEGGEQQSEPEANTVAAQGVTVQVPQIDQQLVDDYNRNTYIAGKRDLNQELRDTATSILDDLAGRPNTLVTDEQKTKAGELTEAYLEKQAEFERWNASFSARNPSWIVTGRSNRNMAKANAKSEKHMDEYVRRVETLEKQRKRIPETLYDMRPDSVKNDQAVKADQKRITQLVADIASYMQDGRNALEKETRKWASPKAHKAIEKALERDRAATIQHLKETENTKTVSDLGGLAKIFGPRSKAGQLVRTLLADSARFSRKRQTETEAFKRWFGDSKVVDENGDPLVVYHGTRGDFNTFEQNVATDLGFHFGESEAAYSRMEGTRGLMHLPGVKADITGENIIPAYLSIQSPLRVTDAGLFSVADPSDNAFAMELRGKGVKAREGMSNRELAAAIESAGYDGLVYENEQEGGESFVALRPSQIKSATGNTGTFDPGNPDIRFANTEYRRTPGQRTESLTADQARTMANGLMKDWKGRPDLTVADSISEFPKTLREAIREAGAEGDMRAVYFDDHVYILAPRIPNEQALQEVILHEVIGHYGLRKMVGGELKPLLNRVYMSLGNTDAANDLKATYYPDGDFDAKKMEHRLTIAEELIAHLAESNQHQKLWNRIKAAIRDGLRKLGFTLELNDTDLLNLLRGAQRAVERGGFEMQISDVFLPVEASRYARSDDSVPFASITGEEIESANGDTLQAKATSYARKNLQGKSFTNEQTGWDIAVSRKGINKTMSHAANETHARSLAALPDLIRNAAFLGTETNRNASERADVPYVHTLAAPMDIGGRKYVARLVIKETRQGQKFYDHDLSSEIDPANLAADAHLPKEGAAASPAGPSMNVAELREIVNSSAKSREGNFSRTGTTEADEKRAIELAKQVDAAYEAGDLDRAEALDAELDDLYDRIEFALDEIQEDGIVQEGNSPSELARLRLSNEVMGSVDDTESGLVDALAQTWGQYTQGLGMMEREDVVQNGRANIEEFGGDTSRASDDQIIELMQDAYENTGKRLASKRGPKGAFGKRMDRPEDIRFSRMGNKLDAAASHFNDLTDQQRTALGKIAPRTPKEKARDWWKERTDRWQTKVRQGAVDRFAALADVDMAVHGRDVIENSTASSSWVLSQMSGSASGALQSMLTTSRISLNKREKVITTQDGTKGLNDTLKQLGSAAEIERFFGWIAGNRSRRLLAEGRENLFEPEEVEALASLNKGTADSGQSRAILYASVFREFQQYRDDVLGIAEDSGIITPEQRETWANEFYVPFYRLAEDDGGFTGPKATGGISRQEAYKKLKGGSQNLNDLLENTMMNFHHLLQASLKNQAAMQAMDNSQEMGIARQVREADRDTENSTFVLRDGQKEWYEIDDPLVFKAVTALAHPGMNSSAMKIMRGFKRLFTNLVTTTPQFVLANLLRDGTQATATSDVSKNILKNMVQGSKAYADPKIKAKMMASGGSFSFGHLYGENADELRLQITGGLARADILRSPSMIPNAISGMWRKWNEMTEFTENINRAAIYQQNVEERGDLYAAFQARDLMNFSQHGAWPAMRVLIDVVPFLSARLNGLDKIYRSGVKPGLRTAMGQGTVNEKQAAMRFWSVTGTIALATIALYLNNRDDEEYQKLEDWQKDTYWFFRISDDHAIFIPKPFEVGAIATLAERLTEQAVDENATGELFADRLSHMLLDTFSFSPVPQAFQPALDIYSNYDAFTGRPIEGMGMERLSPSLRRRNNTTALATGLSSGMESVFGSDGRMTLSPVQIDHAIQGYFGSVGSWVAGVADTIWRTANGETAPAQYWYENQPVRRFYKNLGDEDRYTKYGTEFYEALRETNRVYADIKEYTELGEVERARELFMENRQKMAYRVILNRVQRQLGKVNNAMQQVQRMDASPEYKRRELDRLRAMKNRMQEVVAKKMQEL